MKLKAIIIPQSDLFLWTQHSAEFELQPIKLKDGRYFLNESVTKMKKISPFLRKLGSTYEVIELSLKDRRFFSRKRPDAKEQLLNAARISPRIPYLVWVALTK